MNYVRSESDVFEITSGISLTAWKLVNWLYKNSSPNSIVGKTYKILRKENIFSENRLIKSILGKSIIDKYSRSNAYVLVAHPLLLSILKSKCKLFYQHGELVAPKESIIEGANKIFVPLTETAEPFLNAGYSTNDLIITGLCIEPSLVRQVDDSFNARVNRIKSGEKLTGALFLSGAEPNIHIEIMSKLIISMKNSEHRLIVFANNGGRFHNYLKNLSTSEFNLKFIDSSDQVPYDLPNLLIVLSNNRREENIFTTTFFPKMDFFVAPSHERTNWALGLGLPMFIINPTIGPFSPLNKGLLLRSKVAVSIESKSESMEFDKILSKLYIDGNLLNMAHEGYNKYSIKGFETITDFFDNYLT